MSEPIDQDPAADAEPAAERITRAIVEQLKTIATMSGYWHDVRVTRPMPGRSTPLTHAGIEVDLDSETKDTEGVSFGIEQIRVMHHLICDVVIDEEHPEPVDALLHRLKADVKRCILAKPTLGGLALDTTFGDAVVIDVDGTSASGRIVLECESLYRTLESNPYELLNNPA